MRGTECDCCKLSSKGRVKGQAARGWEGPSGAGFWPTRLCLEPLGVQNICGDTSTDTNVTPLGKYQITLSEILDFFDMPSNKRYTHLMQL